MRLFGHPSAPPITSYGYQAPPATGELWSRIVAPRYPLAITDPDGFCRGLAEQVLPVGGWAMYGAQWLVVELLGGAYAGPEYLRMQDAAPAWLHGRGVGPTHLTGWESARWAATHGDELQDRT